MITKAQFADFDVDAVFTEYADGTVTRTYLGWEGYMHEYEIDQAKWDDVRALLTKAKQNHGYARGYRFAAVFAGSRYR